MGASAYDFVSPEHQSVMRREIERVAATGEPGYYEVQVETDGRWYATRVVPAPAPSDELVLICSDITERRRAEQELRQSQEWFATVFRVCPAATVITRLSDGQLVDANEAFCELTGMNREQLVGERIDQLSMWADLEERQAFINQVRREGVVHGRQCQFLDRQGEPRIGLVSGGCLEVDGQPYLICSARDITELKQTEQMLRENESRLRLMLSQLPAVVWTVDCQLRFTWGAGAALARLGLTPGALIGVSLHEYFKSDEDSFPPIAAHHRALRGESVGFVQEWREATFQAYVEPLRDAESQIVGVVGVALDVTSQRRDQQALQESEERFRQLAESIHEVFYLNSYDEYRALYISPAYEEIWGRPRQELYENPRAWQEALHPDDRRRVTENFERRLQGEGQLTIQYRIVRPDGEIRWIEDQCYPILDKEGRRKRVAGVCSDITERRLAEEKLEQARAELEQRVQDATAELRTANQILREDLVYREQLTRQLRESEERFRSIADGTPVPVTISRLSDGLILYANQRTAEALNSTPKEIMGRRTAEFYHDPAQRERLVELLRRDGHVRDEEVRIRRDDGSTAWLLISLQPMRYEREEAVLAGLVDITERKEAESVLRSERRLLERLIELHERDRQLIAYEIHDGMVQDMTGALMFLQSAQAKVSAQLDQEIESLGRGVELLQESIAEARRLIEGLRPPVLEETGIVSALETLTKETTEPGQFMVEFSHRLHVDRMPPALEMAIYRIVQESLNNARRHSQSPVAKVALRQNEDWLRILVEDQGVGFDPKTVSKRRYGLTGIRERAKLLGGSADIDSRPGGGTRVTVDLPISEIVVRPTFAEGI